MKLTSLLEERNNKPFMLQVQQRLIDDLDIEAELTFEDNRFKLNFEYDPSNDGDGRLIYVCVYCDVDDDMVRIVVNADAFNDGALGDAAVFNIELVMMKLLSLTNRAEATLSN